MTISTPSYIMPGTYLENVQHISGFPEIQSVELLFFMYDDETDKLILEELPGIQEYTGRLGFTVHMPDELQAEHRVIIERTKQFAVQYVLHPPEEEIDSFVSLLGGWIDEYGTIFLLENLIGREFESILRAEPRLGVCMDTGHLLIRGESPSGFAQRYGELIREIHLHGLVDGWDHNEFSGEDKWFQELVPFLRNFRGTCNIEVFKEDQVMAVLEVLRGFSLV